MRANPFCGNVHDARQCLCGNAAVTCGEVFVAVFKLIITRDAGI